MFDSRVEPAALVEQMCAAPRAENRAAAAQLTAIGELFGYRLAHSGETQDWAIDTMEAVAAEVGARCGSGRA
ncbi:hypothetical protein A4G28_17875 [Mycobacterium ostraviense]|uniref:DUF222 domain-containing protein n=1 Tax=Mycobacterium ostraviense TaxID=2738409 RepID=A0A163ZMS1_9MYCO|nr:hypothetical protein A4G28_17875 [Mycobacterium ostraviense]